jgi:hypothetical protein
MNAVMNIFVLLSFDTDCFKQFQLTSSQMPSNQASSSKSDQQGTVKTFSGTSESITSRAHVSQLQNVIRPNILKQMSNLFGRHFSTLYEDFYVHFLRKILNTGILICFIAIWITWYRKWQCCGSGSAWSRIH